MRNLPPLLFGLSLVALFLAGFIPMLDTPSPDGTHNEQDRWARETYQEWTDHGASRSAREGVTILGNASSTCLQAELEHQIEDYWGLLSHPEQTAPLYIAYSVECPEVAQEYEEWLDQSGNWP